MSSTKFKYTDVICELGEESVPKVCMLCNIKWHFLH